MLVLRRICLGAFLATAPLVGCSAIVNPDDTRLGADPDAGGGRDGGVVTLMDSGRPDDAGPPGGDAGMCEEGRTRCAGDALFTCFGGMEVAQDCRAASSFCEGGECRSWVCTPGERSCSSDFRSSVSCNARGSEETSMECPSFCDASSGTCSDGPPPMCDGFDPIRIGEARTIDLCRQSNDSDYQPDGSCSGAEAADSGDATFVLELTEMREVTFELSDIDITAAIDTVVYVRRVCDDERTQVGCHDDVLCSESSLFGGCSGDVYEVRQSRMTLNLPPGRYFVIADAYEYNRDGVRYRCGVVRLRVSAG